MSDQDNEGDDYSTGYGKLAWWATLVVAVLAVPSFGVIAAHLIPVQGLGEIIVFVLACWLCTYLGMRLMSDPKMAEKVDLNKK